MEIANMLLWKMTTSKYFYGNRQLQKELGKSPTSEKILWKSNAARMNAKYDRMILLPKNSENNVFFERNAFHSNLPLCRFVR